MFERFVPAARNVVVAAQREARALGHPAIGTEHLLLGLLDPGSGGAAEVLAGAGVRRDEVVAAIERVRGSGLPLGLGPADAEALRTIGIDLDAVVAAVEGTFGAAALRGPEPAVEVGGRPRWLRWLRPRFLRRRWRRHRELRRRQALIRSGQLPAGGGGGHIPFVPRSKKVLELSLREAVRLRQNHIGPEHILLGLLREGTGLAAQLLVQMGVSLDDLRRRTLTALDAAA